jgi:tape measure domain-containing protein
MATIRTAIELQDNFTSVLYQVINSVNLGLSAMEDLHQTMNSPVDTASIEAARDSINQATIAVQQLDAAMQGIETPETQTPTAPQNSAPVVLPVQPDMPDPLVDQPEPVRVPVQWQSDNLEVFTGSGVERFEQEVQSANNMLNTLNQTQSRIAETAAQTDLFPANAIADMNNMQSRLQAIQQRIQTIESNPLNMGTDTANAELEQLRGQLDQAVQEQQNLNRAVDNMDVQAANEAYLRLSQTVGNTERYIRDNVDEQGRFNREIEEGTNEANELMQTIKGAVAAYATIQTLSAALNLSDQLTSTTARLNLMNDGLQTTQDLQNMIYLSAERARGSYQATADAVSKLGLMAGDAFSSSEEIIAFMEQVNKQFTIAGTEAAGIDAAMLQLTQAMGSGVLRGEEYNSILEQAPNIIQAIADYMEVPKGQLKDMAAEGLITADIVKAAMFAAADDTNAKFEQMPKTFSQIWTSFQNTALMAFQPVLQRMNEIANSEAFQGFVNNAIEALSMVAGIALEIFDLLVGVAEIVGENWSWLSPIIYGVAGALAVYYGAQLAANTISAISKGIHIAMAVAQMIHAAATGALTAATAAEIAAQNGLNAALYACPIVWIIILIIALIALFYAAVAAVNHFAGTSVSATGIICGAFMVALAFIGNIFVALWNLVVDVFVLIYNLVATVANFIGNVFTDPIGAVCRLFFDLADTVLGILQALASAIDAIFGSNLAGSVQGWRDSLGGWVDETFGKGDEVMAKMNADDMKLGRFEYGAAWDAGYSFGEGIDESIANFDPSSLFDTNVPGAGDYADLSNYGAGLAGDVGDIAGNTGAIKDSMDITEEDLKYLRDIAEQEAINRFTTAEITIEQTNHNTVSGKMDLDGIVSGLTDAAREAADIMAEGVHE